MRLVQATAGFTVRHHDSFPYIAVAMPGDESGEQGKPHLQQLRHHSPLDLVNALALVRRLPHRRHQFLELLFGLEKRLLLGKNHRWPPC